MVLDQHPEFLVQPVDASWLQCNIECQEACPVGTNCRGYLNLAAEGRFDTRIPMYLPMAVVTAAQGGMFEGELEIETATGKGRVPFTLFATTW